MIALAIVAVVLTLVYCPGLWRWLVPSLIVFGAVAMATFGYFFPSWQMFGKSLCHISTGRKVVALTFNNGPTPQITRAILDVLSAKKVHATFFCVGERVNLHHELVKQMHSDGHEVENHTFQHSVFFNLYSEKRLRADLTRCQTAIERVTGRAPVFFRPSYGMTSRRLFRVTKELGLRVAGCSIRGGDRRRLTPEKVVSLIFEQIRPGAVILLHDRGVRPDETVAILTLLLDRLEREGYQCARMDELEKEMSS
jgi:peptidoglycan/xylan/chitin deacetylase (PgdA/CDA1 family)